MAGLLRRSVAELVCGQVSVRFVQGIGLYAQHAVRVWIGERASLRIGRTRRSLLHDLVWGAWRRTGVPGQSRRLSRRERTTAGHICSKRRRATDFGMLNLKDFAPYLSRALGFSIPLLLALHWPVIACHVSEVLILTLLRVALLG